MSRKLWGVFVSLVLLTTVFFSAHISQANPALVEIVSMPGEQGWDWFGASVSDAGDLNDDGYDDVIVGAPQNDEGGLGAGKAYIYFGGPIVDDVPDVTMVGASSGDFFGWSVSAAGDVNDDGYDDVIVGARYYSIGGEHIGLAQIFFGGDPMDNTADISMVGESTFAEFGYSVSDAGNVNGDQYDDVIIGAISVTGEEPIGKAYVYYGGDPMNNIADVVMAGDNWEDGFGWSVSAAGDVNDDGYDDVIVGAQYKGIPKGYARIFLGGFYMDNIHDVHMLTFHDSTGFAWSVSGAGDVNDDGYDDVIIGVPWGNLPDKTGEALVYYGGTSMNSVPDLPLTGEATFDHFGRSVSRAGDMDSNGCDDIIVGAPLQGGNDAGKIYVYWGCDDDSPDETEVGEATGDYFGYSVSDSGDVNSNLWSDVIVGARKGAVEKGKAYIYEIEPPNQPPVADFTWSPDPACEGTEIQFLDRSYDPDGTIVSWYWLFEDLTPDTWPNPRRTYGDDGYSWLDDYKVILTVWDDDGAHDTETKYVHVDNVCPTVEIESTLHDNAPRTHGYWKQQCEFDDENPPPSPEHVEIKDEYVQYISQNSQVWAGTTKDEVCEDVTRGEEGATEVEKLRMHLITVWLNIAAKFLFIDSPLNHPDTPATTIRAFILIAEDAILRREAGYPDPSDAEVEVLHQVADAINNDAGRWWVTAPVVGEFEARVEDRGSDDLTLDWDFLGDGSNLLTVVYYNDPQAPEPPYPPTHSPLGAYPFIIIDVHIISFPTPPATFNPRITVEDDDGCQVIDENPMDPWSADWTFEYSIRESVIPLNFTVYIVEVGYLDWDSCVTPIDPETGYPLFG